MNATPLISSTLASAVVFLLMKLAVMAIASFPLNSFLLKPGRGKKKRSTNVRKETVNQWECRLDIEDGMKVRAEFCEEITKGKLDFNVCFRGLGRKELCHHISSDCIRLAVTIDSSEMWF